MADAARAAPRTPTFNSSFIPSPADLLLAIPRFVSFTFTFLPEQLDDLFALAKSPGKFIPDATSKATASNTSLLSSGTTFAQAATNSTAQSASQMPPASGDLFSRIARAVSVSHGVSNMDGIFSYATSRWAMSTFVVALFLNRAHVYASSRRRLRLNWHTRLLLRIIPILLFFHQLERVLQVVRCQSGPMLTDTTLTPSEGVYNTVFVNEGGFLYWLSSTLLFWQAEETSCRASGMLKSPDDPTAPLGSSSILWPLFLCLCLSHFVETVSCALRGRQPMAETGMTIFEHSLAFAEAETVVRSSMGLKLFGASKLAESGVNSLSALSRSIPMQTLNVPPEVLLIALISAFSHLISHVLGILGLQSRCRLAATFLWGTAFMSAFLWSFIKFSRAESNPSLSVIRYPTVCMVGFIPHFMVIIGTLMCCVIYTIALLINLLSPPSSQHSAGTFRNRLKMAHNNLQASTALSNIRISWGDEFYATLMKVGFAVLTAASEAVYFNEGTHVSVGARTWLEEKRHLEAVSKSLAKKQQKYAAMIPPEIQGNHVAEGLSMVDDVPSPPSDANMLTASGFARERKAANFSTKAGAAAIRGEGVGRSQSNGRFHLSLYLFWEISELTVRGLAKLTLATTRKMGFQWSPNWLRSLARARRKKQKRSRPQTVSATTPLWMRTEDGTLRTLDMSVDVEVEARNRLFDSDHPSESEDAVDQHLYGWWSTGGFWGDVDGSGDYVPSHADDDDITSVISTIHGSESDASDSDNELMSNDETSESGRRTPTQDDFRETTPSLKQETLQRMSRLLDPKTLEDRQEARLLARRLQSPGPVTRSQYKRFDAFDRLNLLQNNPSQLNLGTKDLSPEEEEDLLEQLMRSRRLLSSTSAAGSIRTGDADAQESPSGMSWTDGAEGMGAEGPQCVVCRSCPRTILVWPCRCLCLCEECRVSLAMNNFANCVCCRREVVAFSRLFVP